VTITVTPVNDPPIPSPLVQNLTTPEDTPITGQLVANDPEGDPVTFTLEAGPSNGTLTLAPNGAFTFTPTANFSGLAQFVYRASDPSGAFNFGGVNITVTPVDDAPTAVNDAYTVAEDGVLSISASPVTRLRMVSEPGDFIGQGLTYDFNPATAAFRADTNFDNGVSLEVDPTAGGSWFLDFAAANNALLTPGTYLDAQRFPFQAAGKPGLDVSGNGRGSNTLTGRFTVLDVVRNANQDNVLSFAAAFEQHSEGATPALVGWIIFNSTFGAGGGVLANDTDVEGDLLLGAALVSGPSHGSLSFKGDGTFTYTPSANFNGTDSFTYRTNDGRADSNVATVTLNVTPVNDAPVANDGSFTTAEDTTLNGAVSASDADNDPLTYSAVAQDLHGGSLNLNASTGAFTFSPAADYNGPASFTYKVNDGTVDSNVATVNITVAAVNDAPVARNASVTANEDTPVSGTVTATDIDSPTLTYAVVTQPTRGTLIFNAGTGAFTYTPNADFNGADSFTFKANDGAADSNVATVSITVNAVNDPPVASNSSVTTNEDTPVSGTVAATDVDSPTLTFSVVTQPTRGTLSFNTSTGAFTYTPFANLNGPDSFTFKASDGTVDSNVATVSLNVTPVNDAPVAQGQSRTTAEDTPLTGQVVATDVDSTTLTYGVVNGPAHGALTLNPNGSFTYTPSANYNGADSFTFRASDGSLFSNTATVALTVTPVNDPPVTVADSYSAQMNTTLTVTAANGVLRNDTDVDGDPLTAVLNSGPSHGTLTLNADGSFSYRAASGYFGLDTFTYRACDASGALGNVATVTLTVSGVRQVNLDIDTGDKSNTINLNQSKVKVAILSTADFNAVTQVDIDSLTFGRTGTEDSLIYKHGQPVYEISDVNHDGRLDLVVWFDVDDTNLRVGDTSAILIGRLKDGTSIFGTGPVRIKRGEGCDDEA
jgi:VCBS repeat-containing protein